MPAPSLPSTFTRKRRAPGVGESVLRPDAPAKTQGRFAFSSDLWMDGMLWGKTLRSPFPHARITHLDTSPALLVPGVHAVITNDDLWGSRTYGLEHHDQPVFANEVALFHGEPIAAVAADHPEIAARAVAAIKVEYDVLEPLSDP
ncbi:MAG: xanthine dehydrogenase subunit D, partial [Jiangellaceae bacterium]